MIWVFSKIWNIDAYLYSDYSQYQNSKQIDFT